MKLSELPDEILDDPRKLQAAVLSDAQLHAEALLRVRAGHLYNTPIVPFCYNRPQELLHDAIEKQAADKGKVKMVVLKARKMGVSTQIQGRAYKKTSTRHNTEAKIISHDDPSVAQLFAISQLFHESIPDEFKPKTRYSSQYELFFANPDKNAPADQQGLRSRISVTSSRNKNAGRSETLHFVHMSEVAFWEKDPEKLTLSLLNAMPKASGTEVYMESTANGAEGFFYEFWMDAKRHNSGWEAFFIPWWQMEAYRKEPPYAFSLDKEEERLRERFGVTDEQLWWRRMVLADDCRGDVRMFKQEYPSDDTEAFQSSGVNFFPFEKLIALKDIVEKLPVPKRGYLERLPNQSLVFVEDPNGHSIVHLSPDPKMAYAVSVDTSEGTEDDDHDPSNLLVNTCPASLAAMDEEVFEYHGFLEPKELARYMLLVGEWYNWAYLGWEQNGYGVVLTQVVKDESYPSYYEREMIDEATQNITKKAGFHTDARSKPLILQMLKSDISEGRTMPKTKEAIDELVSFKRSRVAHKAGLFSGAAMKGRHDERVITRAIMRELMRSAPRVAAANQANYDRDLAAYYVRR